jgi:hypothetical protein
MLLWRMRDCEKNSKNTFAQEYISHRELQWLTSEQSIELCNNKTNYNWNELNNIYKYWTIFKKENFEKEPWLIRTRIIQLNEKISTNNEWLDFVMKKKL